jgi:hypothetical protein
MWFIGDLDETVFLAAVAFLVAMALVVLSVQ